MSEPFDAKRWDGRDDSGREARADHIEQATKQGREKAVEAQVRLSRELVDPVLLRKEGELQTSAHMQYLYMTPYERTELLAKEYERAKWWFLETRFKFKRPTEIYKPLASYPNSMISAFWHARQEFDRFGLSYPRPIFWVMAKAIEDGLDHLPMPNQLLTKKALSEIRYMWMAKGWWEPAAAEAFEEDNFGGQPDPRFQACNFVGTPQQIRALDQIEAYVLNGKAGDGNYRLGTMLLVYKVMPRTEAIRRFGLYAVQQARTLIKPVDEVLLPTDQEHTPGCLGYGPEIGNAACTNCQFVANCKTLCDTVSSQLLAVYGGTNPRVVREREANAEHQRACRARKRAGSGAPKAPDHPSAAGDSSE